MSAVYREAGGTLDFYYQITNNTTSTNCGGGGQPACDSLARETDFSFLGVSTALGYRLDGATVTPFVTGDIPPVAGDRNVAGDVIGFSFGSVLIARIRPGEASFVLVVSTNATEFTAGHATVSDGSAVTVAAFEPVSPPTISKAFTPTTIALNGTTSLTFTITNPNTTVALAGVAFTDTLPTGLTVASSSATVCGGTFTAMFPTVIVLSGASISAGGQCQFSVTVTGAALGNYTNTTGAVSSTNGGTGNTASANLLVAAPTNTPTNTPTSTATVTPTSTATDTATPVPVVPTLNESGMLIFGLLIAAAGLLLLVRRR